MIIQRLAAALKSQDWFQVIIEVLIVIVGIFLGLQVQGWYEDRADRALELNYLNRLHSDVSITEENAKIFVEQTALAGSILENIQDENKSSGTFPLLSDTACNAVNMSNIYTNYILPVATLDELESTGGSAIIKSEDLRRMMANYMSRHAATDRITNQMMIGAVILAHEYPELIEIRDHANILSIAENKSNVCHSELMNESPGFKNDLFLNISRFTANAGVLSRQFSALMGLHDALDQELGITHRGEAP